jgi:maleamate amidohydrolase
MSWRDVFNDTELSGYRAGGHGQRTGFGAKAAMVVVDMINLYVSPRFALGHGENTQAVIAANKRLIEAARAKGLPIFYSNVGLRRSVAEKGIWGIKVGGANDITAEADTIIPRARSFGRRHHRH